MMDYTILSHNNIETEDKKLGERRGGRRNDILKVSVLVGGDRGSAHAPIGEGRRQKIPSNKTHTCVAFSFALARVVSEIPWPLDFRAVYTTWLTVSAVLKNNNDRESVKAVYATRYNYFLLLRFYVVQTKFRCFVVRIFTSRHIRDDDDDVYRMRTTNAANSKCNEEAWAPHSMKYF